MSWRRYGRGIFHQRMVGKAPIIKISRVYIYSYWLLTCTHARFCVATPPVLVYHWCLYCTQSSLCFALSHIHMWVGEPKFCRNLCTLYSLHRGAHSSVAVNIQCFKTYRYDYFLMAIPEVGTDCIQCSEVCTADLYLYRVTFTIATTDVCRLHL